MIIAKKVYTWVLLGAAALFLVWGITKSNGGRGEETRYDAQFLDLFDTVTSITGYAEDKESFASLAQRFHDELQEYHRLYDIYREYEGINNLKTVNDNAGVSPVEVDRRIIDLLLEAKRMDQETEERMNIAMGSVLSLWHEYRTAGIDNPGEAALPPMKELFTAAEHTDIKQIVIDEEASTVYLSDPEMSLDVGAIAKGYAAEQVCRSLEAEGLTSLLVSVGGNVRAIGSKADGSPWRVGIQNPDVKSGEKYIHSVKLENRSLVTSGTYQRYYTVEGKTYHHIIDPETLMPSDRYLSVTVLCRDSGMADALSTALFNMEPEAGRKLVEGMEDVDALWISKDGSEQFSQGFEEFMEK